LLPAPTAPSEGSAGVRSTWSRSPKGLAPRFSILAHQLRRRFPSYRSLVRGALTSTRLRGPKVRLSFDVRPVLENLRLSTQILEPEFPDRSPSNQVPAKAVRCSAALLGMTSLVSRFAHQDSEEPREPRRTTGRSSLPAPLPGWPEMNPKALPIPAGGDRTFGHLPLPLAVAGSWRGRDRRPDHLITMHMSAESQKRKMWD
jgi:hypothetical protein